MRCLLPLILLSLLLGGCGRPQSGAGLAAFTDTVYAPRYASGFRILGAQGTPNTLLEITNPWQGAEGITRRLLLVRDGSETPVSGDSLQVLDISGGLRVVAMSSSHVAMLSELGCADSIAAISGLRFIHNPQVQRRASAIADIGYEGAIDFEALVGCRPSLVLLYGVSGADAMEPKLRELGIPYIYVGDYMEQSPLGKAEWVVALGEIMGRRAQADSLFSEIPRRYKAVKALAAQMPGPRPRVMVNTPYADSWFMPPAGSYLVRLIADAGGEYVYTQNRSTTSVAIPTEEAYLLACSADRWMNVGAARSLEDVRRMCPKFADTPLMRSGQVYNDDRRVNNAGGNDYWESGVMHPDVVLRDMLKIMHPREMADTPFTYYRQLLQR